MGLFGAASKEAMAKQLLNKTDVAVKGPHVGNYGNSVTYPISTKYGDIAASVQDSGDVQWWPATDPLSKGFVDLGRSPKAVRSYVDGVQQAIVRDADIFQRKKYSFDATSPSRTQLYKTMLDGSGLPYKASEEYDGGILARARNVLNPNDPQSMAPPNHIATGIPANRFQYIFAPQTIPRRTVDLPEPRVTLTRQSLGPSPLGIATAAGAGLAAAGQPGQADAATLPKLGEMLGGTPEALARAKAQGFDTDRVFYRGTNSDETHAGRGPGDKETWMTTDPEYAGAYGNNVMPLYVRGNLLNPREEAQAGLREESYKALTKRGVTGAFSGDVAHVWDPAAVRSVHAAFDPAKSGSSDLLAGIGLGGAAVGGAMLAGQPTDASASALSDAAKFAIHDFPAPDIPRSMRNGDRHMEMSLPDGRTMRFQMGDNLGDGDAYIDNPTLPNDLRGQGLGSRIIKTAADDALARGKAFTSGSMVSPDGVRLWESLERQGYGIEKSPHYPDPLDGYYTGKSGPIFRAVSGPAAKALPFAAGGAALYGGSQDQANAGIPSAYYDAMRKIGQGPVGDAFKDSRLAALSRAFETPRTEGYYDPAAADALHPRPQAQPPMSGLQTLGTRGGRIQPDAADAITAGVTAPMYAAAAGGALAPAMGAYVASQRPQWEQNDKEQDWLKAAAQRTQQMKQNAQSNLYDTASQMITPVPGGAQPSQMQQAGDAYSGGLAGAQFLAGMSADKLGKLAKLHPLASALLGPQQTQARGLLEAGNWADAPTAFLSALLGRGITPDPDLRTTHMAPGS